MMREAGEAMTQAVTADFRQSGGTARGIYLLGNIVGRYLYKPAGFIWGDLKQLAQARNHYRHDALR